ncbi:undecaprenyl-diphosphate phosphatase [Candidatus Collierbacteria bacterium]|nr:undecaprenyl-diphosphate phosphatase [Candidatus Collierbacteria bacterium]
MNFFHAIVLGAIEGITEFLPVSSTFHLIFTGKFLGLPSDEFLKFFEVFIQSGAIAAVALLFLAELKNTSPPMAEDQGLLHNVIISFIPTAIIGFILHTVIKNIIFEKDLLLISASFFIGLVFIVAEIFIKKGYLRTNLPISKLTIKGALLIGLFQSLAVIPGVSRSGATILGLLILGFNRSEAAIYSFLLAIPTIISASALDLAKTPLSVLTSNHIALLSAGFISSFIFAHFSAHWLIEFLKKHTLIPFGIYRIILSAILFFIFLSSRIALP